MTLKSSVHEENRFGAGGADGRIYGIVKQKNRIFGGAAERKSHHRQLCGRGR